MAFGTAATKEARQDKPESDRPMDELFVPATKLAANPFIKIGIWGRAKVGKSHFALTVPDGKIFVIDTENAIGANVLSFPPKDRERIFVSEILNFADKERKHVDVVHALDVMFDAIDKITQYVREHPKEPITVVVDSATDIWDWLGIWLDTADGTKHIAGGEKINRLEWGKANKKYADAFLMLMQANCNVILTFRAKEAVGSDGQNLGVFTARWQKNTDYWLHLIVNIEREGTKRIMRFKGGRYGESIPELENPDFPKLLKHIEKHSGVKFK